MDSVITSLFFLLVLLPVSRGEDDPSYAECQQPFVCGLLDKIPYPFYGNVNRTQRCGHEGYRLLCEEGQNPIIESTGQEFGMQEFRVLDINDTSKEMTMVPKVFWDNTCPGDFFNISLNETLFNLSDYYRLGIIQNISLFYDCSNENIPSWEPFKFQCSIGGEEKNAYFATLEVLEEVQKAQLLRECSITIEVPVLTAALPALNLGEIATLQRILRLGFNVSYVHEQTMSTCKGCRESHGICGTNMTSPDFTFACLCQDQPYPQNCPGYEKGDKVNIERKVIVGVCAAVVSVIIMCLIFFIYQRRKKNQYAPSYFVSRSTGSYPSSKGDMEKGMSSYFGVRVNLFSYEELEEATKNFASDRELGDGGFGTVYYGRLKDGREVAVKRLYENNYRRVEQFMNEVEILTRLRHQHLVALYGCTSRHSRELLLVYEYIPNGTVADHLHGEKAKPGALKWPTRLNIAVETATALSYLHASEIVHRDVKTNNILLDKNFCVKVADFGLSRLFPSDVSHISTTPQGTPGYVDPEYHQCYQLTSKSDVYSFGVVLIELISSLPAVDITRHRHDINLSNMAISKIQSNTLHEIIDPSLGFESNETTKNMIYAVAELAFQCLQSEKEARPSMEEVLGTLLEIQNEDNSTKKTDVVDVRSDDVGLLKNGLPLSPVSVTEKWISSSSTSNTSG